MKVACVIAPQIIAQINAQINAPQINLAPAKLPIVLGSPSSARCPHDRHSHNQQ
ncbi:MAG: hypothetical protein QOJ42_8135, partial [Acidobacteriaceae bacterium]|nr:hypothetical protein [Acidobacteriaceae bacterium]